MDDHRARFSARIQLHLRDGWEVVQIDDDPTEPLSALLTKITIGPPRAPGRGVARQAGTPQRACRRITVDQSGAIRVNRVACPPEVMIQPGSDADLRA